MVKVGGKDWSLKGLKELGSGGGGGGQGRRGKGGGGGGNGQCRREGRRVGGGRVRLPTGLWPHRVASFSILHTAAHQAGPSTLPAALQRRLCTGWDGAVPEGAEDLLVQEAERIGVLWFWVP